MKSLVENQAAASFRRPLETLESYFDALEVLRGHLNGCLRQVAAVAGMDVPAGSMITPYGGEWQTDAYIPADKHKRR